MTQQTTKPGDVTEAVVYRLARDAVTRVSSRQIDQVSEILSERHGWIWPRRNKVVVGREPTLEKMNVIYYVVPDPEFVLDDVVTVSESIAVIYWTMEGYCPSLLGHTKVKGLWLMDIPTGLLTLTIIIQEGGKALKPVKDLDTQQRSRFSLGNKSDTWLDEVSTLDPPFRKDDDAVGAIAPGIHRSPGKEEHVMDTTAQRKVQALVDELGPEGFQKAVRPVLADMGVKCVNAPVPGALTVPEAAEKYGVDPQTLRKWVDRQRVRIVYRPNRRTMYISEEDVQRRVQLMKEFKEKNQSRFADPP